MTTYIDEYHKLYESARIWEKNKWFDIPCFKLPMDMMVIQELIVKIRPEYIIETGTGKGGSAMFYASICELLGEGHVITIDNKVKYDLSEIGKYIWCDRIEFLEGSSTDQEIKNIVYQMTEGSKRNMVILDSWHSENHVHQEMCMYSKFVNVGSYMIVEDTHAGGNPIEWKYDDRGPMGAVDRWMVMYGDYWEVDLECEKHLLSFNPRGYLRRIK